jgi:hypothetical protein
MSSNYPAPLRIKKFGAKMISMAEDQRKKVVARLEQGLAEATMKGVCGCDEEERQEGREQAARTLTNFFAFSDIVIEAYTSFSVFWIASDPQTYGDAAEAWPLYCRHIPPELSMKYCDFMVCFSIHDAFFQHSRLYASDMRPESLLL